MGQRYFDLSKEEQLKRYWRAFDRVHAGEDKQKVLNEEMDGFDFDGCKSLGSPKIGRLHRTGQSASSILKGGLEILQDIRINVRVQIHEPGCDGSGKNSLLAVYYRKYDSGCAKSDEVATWIEDGLARAGKDAYAMLLREGNRVMVLYRRNADGKVICIGCVPPFPEKWLIPFVDIDPGEITIDWTANARIDESTGARQLTNTVSADWERDTPSIS